MTNRLPLLGLTKPLAYYPFYPCFLFTVLPLQLHFAVGT